MTPYRVKENRRKKMKKQPTFKKVNMNFPPGRPTEHVIASLCRNQKQRPLFNTKCLPGSGYELVALQAKTINRIEQGFKQCCKQKWNILNCAERKWRDELDKFCLGENGERVDYHCCSAGGQTDDNYRCFQNASADQYFIVTAASKELSLQNICGTHKIIKKKFPLGLPINSVVQQCCLLQDNDRSSCLDKRLKGMANNLCSSKKRASVTFRQCCRGSSPHDAPECISDILVAAINKAAKVQQKKRRRCPLS